MGRQHGEQLRASARAGMLDFYFRLWERIQQPHGLGKWQTWAMKQATGVTLPWLLHTFAKNVPPWMNERMEGMREALGEDKNRIMTALVLPDLLPFLQSIWVSFRPGDFVASDAPRFGCTSFLAHGSSFFLGRNLDFPGVNYWDRFPVIQTFQPARGLNYVGVLSAGVPLAGITGLNEAQIAVSVHQHYSRTARIKGQLPFVFGEQILRECSTLAQAEEVLAKAQVSASWAFVVADGKTGEGFLYELSPNGRGIKKLEGGALGHSNQFQTTSCQAFEYATTSRMNWDNHCRRERLLELVKKAGAGLAPAAAVQALCDHWDPYWNEPKVANRTVSQVYNIQSVLFDMVQMKFWAAEGESPIHLGSYAQFDVGRLLAGEEGRTGESLPGYQFGNPSMGQAKRSYISSFVDSFEGNHAPALTKIRIALKYFEFPEGLLVEGILSLRLGEHEAGLASLQRGVALVEEKAAGLSEVPPEYFELRLYEARALDLLGRRSEATQKYFAIESDPRLSDRRLRALAKGAGPFTQAWLERIWMPYAAYIPFQ